MGEVSSKTTDGWFGCGCGEKDGFNPEYMSPSECAAHGCKYEAEDEEAWCECGKEEAMCASAGGEWTCVVPGPMAFKGFPPPEVCDYDEDEEGEL